MNIGTLLALSLCSGLALFLSFEWVLYPWQRPYGKSGYQPSSTGSNHLKALIRVLGEVHAWLGIGHNPITQGLEKGLWEQINYLKIEQDGCTAIFSPKSNERIWAIRRLSEYKTRRVLAVIYAIAKHSQTSDEVRTIAQEILRQNNYEPPSRPRPEPGQGKDSPKRGNGDGSINVSTTNVFHVKDGPMSNGDTYNVGQGGAVGRNAQAHDFTMNQNYNDIDLAALAKELDTLRLELKKRAQTPEEDRAIGAVASAGLEIQRGDRAKALEYLKQAGKWALEVATGIGVGLAVAALKTALGV